jgi:hypothetical protein
MSKNKPNRTRLARSVTPNLIRGPERHHLDAGSMSTHENPKKRSDQRDRTQQAIAPLNLRALKHHLENPEVFCIVGTNDEQHPTSQSN